MKKDTPPLKALNAPSNVVFDRITGGWLAYAINHEGKAIALTFIPTT